MERCKAADAPPKAKGIGSRRDVTAGCGAFLPMPVCTDRGGIGENVWFIPAEQRAAAQLPR